MPAFVVAGLVAAIGCTASPPATASGPQVRFEPVQDGDLATRARAFAARARGEGRQPLVYVGATWCEPCRPSRARVGWPDAP